jgi:hypothetical protein
MLRTHGLEPLRSELGEAPDDIVELGEVSAFVAEDAPITREQWAERWISPYPGDPETVA